MAITARSFGVKVLKVSMGFGPSLFSYKGYTVKLFILGGFIQMLDSRIDDLEESDLKYTFDHQNRLKKALIPLSGCVGLIIIPFIILGGDALTQLYTGIYQITLGSLKPISIGSEYVSVIVDFVSNNTLIIIFAFTSIKLAAFNLLPLPVLNGGQVIIEILSPPEKICEVLFKMGALTLFIIIVSWLLAIFTFAW
tara:strand:- start:2508 stop:3092 length:585 start_codon:yes stop_codon:yes gene_type:complete